MSEFSHYRIDATNHIEGIDNSDILFSALIKSGKIEEIIFEEY